MLYGRKEFINYMKLTAIYALSNALGKSSISKQDGE